MNVQAILADKWVRISGGILAVVFAITFLPLLIGYQPDGGLVFFNIVLALVFVNVVVQRHPIMSLRWLYGIDLGLGVLLLLAALPAFSESALAGITALILIPLNCWTGYQFVKEMGRTASLQGTFLPAHEGGLTLEFTPDGNLILSNGKVYRYVTRRNDLLLYDGDTLATKWEIAKCDMKTLMVKDDQGKLHEYKRDFSAVKSAASTVGSGLGAVWNALRNSQENARLQAKWTAQGGSSPSIEFTGDGAFVRSDGKAGKYTVDWDSKTISVTLTDKTPLVFEIVSLSPTQLVLSLNGVATTYTTSMGTRLGFGGGQSGPTSSPSAPHTTSSILPKGTTTASHSAPRTTASTHIQFCCPSCLTVWKGEFREGDQYECRCGTEFTIKRHVGEMKGAKALGFWAMIGKYVCSHCHFQGKTTAFIQLGSKESKGRVLRGTERRLITELYECPKCHCTMHNSFLDTYVDLL